MVISPWDLLPLFFFKLTVDIFHSIYSMQWRKVCVKCGLQWSYLNLPFLPGEKHV